MSSFASALLKMAMALLLTVQNNPSVSQAQQQEAIQVATRAIALANSVLGNQTDYPQYPPQPPVITGDSASKTRDARRVSNLRQMQNALELYYNSCNRYPGGANCEASMIPSNWEALNNTLVKTLSNKIPNDPLSSRSYFYVNLNNGQGYVMGAQMENTNQGIFQSYMPPTQVPSGHTCIAPEYCVSVLPPQPIGYALTVLSPNGGEVWHPGETKRIKWNSAGVSLAMIYIYDSNISGSGSTNYITPNGAAVPAAQGYYDWTIPALNQLPGGGSTNYRIRIDAVDNGMGNVTTMDSSDQPFTIQAATAQSLTITSISPSQGGAGTEVTIYGTGLSDASSIEFYNLDGTLSGSIRVSSHSPNKATFTVDSIFAANSRSGTYQIRVVSNSCPGGCSSSDSLLFTLQGSLPQPTITVTAPSGGETWQLGTTQTPTWSGPSGCYTVTIEDENGFGAGMIADGSACSNSYIWRTGSISTASDRGTIYQTLKPGRYKLRVGLNGASGVSAAAFTVSAAPMLLTSCTDAQNSKVSSFFNTCRVQGFDSVCFSKFSGEFQGCVRNDRDDCTTFNMNAASNLLCSVSSQRPKSTITVTAPNTRDVWKLGQQGVGIHYESSVYGLYGTKPVPVQIDLLRYDGGSSYTVAKTIATGLLKGGGFSWNVPYDLTPGTYVVRVMSSVTGETVQGTSASFSIIKDYSQPSISVTYPNGGETVDLLHGILTVGYGVSGIPNTSVSNYKVFLELEKDDVTLGALWKDLDGNVWKPLTSNAPGQTFLWNGSYYPQGWDTTAAAQAGSGYKIRASLVDMTQVSVVYVDKSEQSFTITNAASPASLSVGLNGGLSNPSYVPGTAQALLASFVLNTPANQSTSINSITVTPTSMAIQNMKLYVGGQKVGSFATVYANSPIYFGITNPIQVPPGRVVSVDVNADVMSSATPGAYTAPISLTSVSGTLGFNGNVGGQSVTVMPMPSISSSAPTISSFSPASGPPGTSVTITGSGFSSTNNYVNFGGYGIQNLPGSSDGKTITFTVPSVSFGATQVYVATNWGQSQPVNFTVTLAAQASLTVAKNSAMSDIAMDAGVAQVKIGSYTISAGSASAVNLSAVTIQMGANASNLQNLVVKLGGATLNYVVPMVSPNTVYSFSLPVFATTIPAGNTQIVDVYADVSTNASGTMSPATSFVGCVASSVTAQTSVPCGNVTGQAVTVVSAVAPTLSAGFDTSTPPSQQVVMGATGVLVGNLRLTNTASEDEKLNTLVLTVRSTDGSQSGSPYQNLTVWDGSTQVAGNVVAPVPGSLAIYLGTPLVIPKNSTKTLTLKADLATYTNLPAVYGHAYQISLDGNGVYAVGSTSAIAAQVNLGTTTTNPQTIVRTKVAAALSTYGTASNRTVSAADDIATLTLSADPAFSSQLKQVTFTFSGIIFSANPPMSVSLLDVDTGVVLVNGTLTTGPSQITLTPSQPWVIPAGTSKSFRLRIDSTKLAGGASGSIGSLTVNILNVNDLVWQTLGMNESLGLSVSNVPLAATVQY